MRLTNDVILDASVSINPLKQRELILRGYKAPAIENLGITKDAYDCIDFSDNDIKKLENFPRFKRLRMLIFHSNHISKIQPNLHESIPNLQVLILTNNKLASLSDLEPLSKFLKLDIRFLYIYDRNAVTKRKFYREYMINLLPQLRILDYQKVGVRERQAAEKFFQSNIGIKYKSEVNGHSIQDISNVSPGESICMTDIPSGETNMSLLKAPEPLEDTNMRPSKEPEPTEDTNMSHSPSSPEPNSVSPEFVYTPSKPIEKMTVAILKKELKKLHLPTNGLKAELAQRLAEAAKQS